MIVKKSPQANLENKRLPLFFLGILFATAIVLSAFEWRTYEEIVVVPTTDLPLYLDDEQIFTAVVQKEKLKAPAPRQPNPDELIIVETIDEPFPDLDLSEPDEPVIEEIDFNPETGIVEPEIVIAPDEMPEFPGGQEALGKFLKLNLNYPAIARDAGVSGSVWITFVVNKKGEIEDIKIAKSVSPACDREAERVVRAMPKWKPGLQRGVPVKVQYYLPIKYTLTR